MVDEYESKVKDAEQNHEDELGMLQEEIHAKDMTLQETIAQSEHETSMMQ